VYARLELRALVEDALDGLLNLDTRVLRTLADLSFAPARVCRDYLDGRRVPYIHPFKYALATFAVAFAIAQLSARLHGAPDDPRIAFVLEWGQLLNLVALPVLASVLWLLFMRAPRSLGWVEHYVVVLYAMGHVALLQGLLNPLIGYIGDVGTVVFAALPIAFLSWTGVGVYRTPWWSTILRMLVGFVIMQVAVGAPVLAITGL
jgi:hypothetical protein